MSKCPKCGKKLRLFDIKQTCPHCGVNLMFYGFEDRFYEDAKYAEMGFAKIRVILARVKAAFVGGRLQIARLALGLFPLLSLLLPLGTVSVNLPLFSKDYSFGILGLYGAFSDETYKYIFGFSSGEVIGETASLVTAALIACAVVAVFALLQIVGEMLCFLNRKRMSIFQCITSALGVAANVYAAISVYSCVAVVNESGQFTSGKIGFGGYISAVFFIALLVINALLVKKGIAVDYREGDLLRVETAQKLKKGEITLADIPQPIYETEQERAEREAAIADTMKPKNETEADGADATKENTGAESEITVGTEAEK